MRSIELGKRNSNLTTNKYNSKKIDFENCETITERGVDNEMLSYEANLEYSFILLIKSLRCCDLEKQEQKQEKL